MATSLDFIEYVCEQINDIGRVKYKKMFGEYMVYVDDKPVLLVCDNTVFVKKIAELNGKIEDTGMPYTGAKEHYILDIDNREYVREIVKILVNVIEIPKKKGGK